MSLMLNTEQSLLAAIHADPGDHVAWLALADWMEEDGRPDHAEQLRLQLWLTGNLDHAERAAREARQRRLLDGGLVPCGPRLTLPLGGGEALTASLLPAGQFWMGRDERPFARGKEGPRHKVTLTRAYCIGTTPVTQRQWYAVMGDRPAHHPGPDRPVDRVNWQDCQRFCERVSEQTGRTVRLPTEAEWEYACRAGISADYYSGDEDDDLRRVAWFEGNTTHDVAGKQPNGWGLYDMLGNVWEWTRDAYRDFPTSGRPRTNPARNQASSYRAARGGSYSNPSGCCRSAGRICFAAGGRNDFIGFRVVVECEGEG